PYIIPAAARAIVNNDLVRIKISFQRMSIQYTDRQHQRSEISARCDFAEITARVNGITGADIPDEKHCTWGLCERIYKKILSRFTSKKTDR
ncbi:TPA: hypothetical protein ACWV53_005089, partial [Salmonella enterica subsp. enterica serovar Muenchen]